MTRGPAKQFDRDEVLERAMQLFWHQGYEATGMCLALGNYHNVDRKKGKLGPEYVDLRDFDHVVKWFVELARAPISYTGNDEALEKQLRDLEKNYKRLLRSSLESPR